MPTPPIITKNRGYVASSTATRPISSFFTPVRKPEDPVIDRPKITVKHNLKSVNLKPPPRTSSTESLSRSLSKVAIEKPKPLLDLNTPTRRVFEIDDTSDVEEEQPTRRVLRRKRKPIVLDSEEEEDDDMEEQEPATKSKRPKIVLDEDSEEEDSEREEINDDDSGGEDEAYVDENEKINNTTNDPEIKVNIERIQHFYPHKPVWEIMRDLQESRSAVAVMAKYHKQDRDRGWRKNDDEIEALQREKLSKLQRGKVVLDFFNVASGKEIQDITGCKEAIAALITDTLRPFNDLNDLEEKLRTTKGTSVKYIANCEEMMEGYNAVDQIIETIENLGTKLRGVLKIWRGLDTTPAVSDNEEQDKPDEKAGTHLLKIDVNPSIDKSSFVYKDATEGYLSQQPDIVNKEFTLKDYQILGVNWMLLLYRKGISGILADEMGLGKTAQVISFLGRLFELGDDGPHLVIVPSSTLENWQREFERFCPDLTVELYHGSLKERTEQRDYLLYGEDPYQIVITTYTIATSNEDDRKFLRRLGCKSMILDEGHMIKNCTSARYKNLMRIKTDFRLLLTGTPLQNNLQELVSLLVFIMPETFAEHEEEVRSIFKIRTQATDSDKDSSVQVLSKERITRAKKMMTPFILRRKKQDVLKDLPQKQQIVKLCQMTTNQRSIYNNIIRMNKRSLRNHLEVKKKSAMDEQFESMSNVIIHLRKAADHPLLFRNIYTDELLKTMAKEIKKDVKYWDSVEEYIYEDMTIMSDFELNNLCLENKTIKHHKLANEEWMDSGKVDQLKEILPYCISRNEKVLIFSQFTRMLDILQLVMSTMNISYVRLDGETKVMDRQTIIDNFNSDPSLSVFLLSTKAGGFGINLTSANVVVLYDLDFNPQNDKQAEDRAHRVGQTKDVRIIKLISKDSIEEYILKTAEIKLRLDNHISKEGDDGEEQEDEQQGLQSILRQAFKQVLSDEE